MFDVLKDKASGLDYVAIGETKSPKHVFVMLHGTGDNCVRAAELAEVFSKKLSETLILVPNGPVSFAELFPADQIEAAKKQDPNFDAEKMRNWAGASKKQITDEESMIEVMNELMGPPSAAINALIDGQLSKYGLTDSDVVIYGFSAGGMAALYAGISRDKPCASVISHSGQFMGIGKVVSKPKTLFIFGDQELAHEQISELFLGSVDMVRALGIKAEKHICKDLGHDVNQEAFDKIINFTSQAFAQKADVAAPTPVEQEPEDRMKNLQRLKPSIKWKKK